MKTAIVYYSLTGNTEWVTEKIAESLRADRVRLIPQKVYPDKGLKKFLWGGKSAIMGETPALEAYAFDLSAYDLIILGTPVWASTFAPPIRTFLQDNKEQLLGKRLAVVTCYSGGGADKAIAKMLKFLDRDAFDAQLILIDPKDKADEKNEQKIRDFCQALQKESF